MVRPGTARTAAVRGHAASAGSMRVPNATSPPAALSIPALLGTGSVISECR